MKFRIHFEREEGVCDYIDIEGETIEDIRTKVKEQLAPRYMDTAWSEEL